MFQVRQQYDSSPIIKCIFSVSWWWLTRSTHYFHKQQWKSEREAGAGAGHTGSLGWGSGEQQNQGEMTVLRAAQSENQLGLDGEDEKGREGWIWILTWEKSVPMKTERRWAGWSSRTPWSANENSPLSLGVCYRWQEQSNSPGGSQDIAAGRSQGLTAKLPVRRETFNQCLLTQERYLGLFHWGFGRRRRGKKKKSPTRPRL